MSMETVPGEGAQQVPPDEGQQVEPQEADEVTYLKQRLGQQGNEIGELRARLSEYEQRVNAQPEPEPVQTAFQLSTTEQQQWDDWYAADPVAASSALAEAQAKHQIDQANAAWEARIAPLQKAVATMTSQTAWQRIHAEDPDLYERNREAVGRIAQERGYYNEADPAKQYIMFKDALKIAEFDRLQKAQTSQPRNGDGTFAPQNVASLGGSTAPPERGAAETVDPEKQQLRDVAQGLAAGRDAFGAKRVQVPFDMELEGA